MSIHTAAAIDIVLASYNGERFIAEQIRSIQSNSFYTSHVCQLIVVDDGSSDQTLSILKSLQAQDSKIELYSSEGRSLGSSKNFCRGISLTTAPYVMLCDQDDVWLSDKIEKSYNLMRSVEQPDLPALVFTDLKVVDEQLNELSHSYFDLKKIPKQWHTSFTNLLQQNVASGCTMLFNRALIDKAMPIPEGAYMHDWWLILVAQQFGRVDFLNESTMLYRQHSTNVVGARPDNLLDQLLRFPNYWNKFSKSLYSVIEQAGVFEKRFSRELPTELRQYLNDVSKISDRGLLHKLRVLGSGKLFRHTLKAKLVLCLVILLGRKPAKKV